MLPVISTSLLYLVAAIEIIAAVLIGFASLPEIRRAALQKPGAAGSPVASY